MMKRREGFVAMVLCVALVAFAFGCSQEAPKQEAPKPAPAAGPAPASPPLAGGVPLGVSTSQLELIVNGWSASKQILGKDVYNEQGEKVGKVDDLLIAPNNAVSYAIVSAGGFLGVDKNDVAIPMNQLKIADGKITLPGATKDALKAMPKFEYAK
ncbi:MAG TPA: PRC-barrel domain-containing protein [Syntrophorhabdaceae bacterium]|jgi:sporulation protein YlmC with PRC-barrel domain